MTFHIETFCTLEMKNVIRMKEKLIATGKTKRVFTLKRHPEKVVIESLDDITADDGAKHDVITEKAEYATETTCNVFRLLNRNKVPTSFIEKLGPKHFLAWNCEMIPIEVVVRRVALGSYLKRNPSIESGTVLDDLIVEFYLKTKDRIFKGVKIPRDDPYMELYNGSVFLYDPGRPLSPEVPVEAFTSEDVFNTQPLEKLSPKMQTIAKKTFSILEEVWQNLGYVLADFKIEFGLDHCGQLVVADVIDNDSWRVLDAQGRHVDKQLYRDGVDLKSVKGKYQQVAELTRNF